MSQPPIDTLLTGDCAVVLQGLLNESVDLIVTDPPYGLEFMGKEWDAPWKVGAGFSKPGIGERDTPWPSFTGANDEFGGANPTCAVCGLRQTVEINNLLRLEDFLPCGSDHSV